MTLQTGPTISLIYRLKWEIAKRMDTLSWTNHPVYTSVWYADFTEGNPSRVKENGVTLTEKTTFSDCNTTASSWIFLNNKLYVHTSGGTSPVNYIVMAFFWDYFASEEKDFDGKNYKGILDAGNIPQISMKTSRYFEGGSSQSFGSIKLFNEGGYFDSRLSTYVHEGKYMELSVGNGLAEGDSYSDVPYDDSPHADVSHTDVNTYSDVAHSDSHTDVAHSDTAYVDTPHSDYHTDTPHVDEAHLDSAYTDIAHTDTAHANTVHIDVPYLDQDWSYTDDMHADESHGDIEHTNVAHVDTAYGDIAEQHIAHIDSAYSDVNHGDVAHSDTAAVTTPHSDVAYSDVVHQDVAHTDAAHVDIAHEDIASIDDAHTDSPTIDFTTFWVGWSGNILWSDPLIEVETEDFRKIRP